MSLRRTVALKALLNEFLFQEDLVEFLYCEFVFPAEQFEFEQRRAQRILFRIRVRPYIQPVGIFYSTVSGKKRVAITCFGTFGWSDGKPEYYITETKQVRMRREMLSCLWVSHTGTWRTINSYISDHALEDIGSLLPDEATVFSVCEGGQAV